MKKFLIAATSLVSIFIQSAYASGSSGQSALSGFFVKATIGANQMQNVVHNTQLKAVDAVAKVKLKAKNTPFLGIGIGYNFTDEFRADITLEHYFRPNVKGSNKVAVNVPAPVPATPPFTAMIGNASERHKTKLDSVMLNLTFDIYSMGMFKFFIGGGVGVAQIKESSTIIGTVNTTSRTIVRRRVRTQTGVVDVNETVTSKKTNNFAYAGMVGIAANITSKVSVEGAYSLKVFGKAKKTNTKYSGHNLNVGIRFNI